ncbi:hypothetical protein C4546_03020 [Candidatus Parcubacteria bacterium]|jgi:ABC-type uncharacterized transport system permease subunit|nr:MAG: hypothetical protein C4546_03020 [Candidatus Parcubacteria bacterium]
MSILKAIFGILIFLLAGYSWSLLFFKTPAGFNFERAINAIILGIIFNTIFIYMANRFGLSLNYLNIIISILVCGLVPAILLIIKKYFPRIKFLRNKP